MAVERLVGLLLALCCAMGLYGQDVLERRVTVEAARTPLARALSLVAQEGGFKLSYDATAFPVDSLVDLRVADLPVGQVLRTLLGPKVQVRASGSHVVLARGKPQQGPMRVEGLVLDAVSARPVARASVYTMVEKRAVRSDAQGRFKLDIQRGGPNMALLVACEGYRDTLVQVRADGLAGTVVLVPRPRGEYMELRCPSLRCGVEEAGVAKLLISQAQADQARNLSVTHHAFAQASLVPGLGTNGELSGLYTNRLSFNLVAGYAGGLEGLELGGGANLERGDVTGVQIAGGANLVGGDTRGIQLAGAANHTYGTMRGVQVAGGFNSVQDTLTGVQVAGGFNMVRGSMQGVQVAGGANVAIGSMQGTQVAGGANITWGDVQKSQVAAGFNMARSVGGSQFAFGANTVSGRVGGGQVSFGMNVARELEGGQFTFGLNAVPGPVSGGQVAFGMNYAHRVEGGQFAFGMNCVPGEVSGGQVAFGMNYAHQVNGGQFALGANVVPHKVAKGQFALGLNYAEEVVGGQVSLGLNVVSGTARGGQVGVLNVARHAERAQVGIINISASSTAVPIGLLSIVRHGYHRADLFNDDVLRAGVALRTGVRAFYNILRVAPPLIEADQWAYGYGFGSQLRLGKRSFLALELTADQIQPEQALEQNEQERLRLQLLCRFAPALVVELGTQQRWTITAGPHAQLLIQDRSGLSPGYTNDLLPSKLLHEQFNGNTHLAGWLGGSLAVGYRF